MNNNIREEIEKMKIEMLKDRVRFMVSHKHTYRSQGRKSLARILFQESMKKKEIN